MERVATKEYLEEWKKLYLLTHTYPSTETYYSFIKRFVGEGIIINQKTIDKFRETNMSSPASASLKSFCKFLVRRKDFPEVVLNIKYDRNKPAQRFPKSIPLSDIYLLANNMTSLKAKIITRVIFEGALRISEVLGLKWESLNYSEWLSNQEDYGKLTILKTKRNKFRVIPISSELMKLLYSVVTNKTAAGIPIGNLVFDFGIQRFIERKEFTNDRNLYDYMCYAENLYREELYKISKLVLNKRISPHYLRHSRAQMLLNAGFSLDSLKMFLGHNSISSTEIYASASSEKVKKELIAYDTLNKPKTNENQDNKG